MNIQLLPEFVMQFMLVFARVGAMIMLLPGLGEQVSPQRVRLTMAIFITLVALPLVRGLFPVNLADLPAMIRVLLLELLIGMTFGLAGRFLMSSLQGAGVLISQQMGLSYTQTVDPTSANQGQSAAIGNFLSLLGISLIFTANLHHVALMGIIDSYKTLIPGEIPLSGDAAQLAITVATSSFTVAVQISAPFLVFGLVFNVGLGILSRMMPQLQIFFLALPASVLIGTIIFIFVLPLMMNSFIAHVAEIYREFFPGVR